MVFELFTEIKNQREHFDILGTLQWRRKSVMRSEITAYPTVCFTAFSDQQRGASNLLITRPPSATGGFPPEIVMITRKAFLVIKLNIYI